MEALQPSFYARHPLVIAPDLLGKWVVHESVQGRMIGRIVETEAYRYDEAGCHAWKNVYADGSLRDPNLISAGLFDAPGTSYIYISYGLHWMLNVVCEPEGVGAGVLIRAIEPIEGLMLMQQNRGIFGKNPKLLTNGPGKLCQAFGIDRRLHRLPLDRPPLYFTTPLPSPAEPFECGVSPRIGLAKGMGDTLAWRFFIKGSPWVSR